MSGSGARTATTTFRFTPASTPGSSGMSQGPPGSIQGYTQYPGTAYYGGPAPMVGNNIGNFASPTSSTSALTNAVTTFAELTDKVEGGIEKGVTGVAQLAYLGFAVGTQDLENALATVGAATQNDAVTLSRMDVDLARLERRKGFVFGWVGLLISVYLLGVLLYLSGFTDRERLVLMFLCPTGTTTVYDHGSRKTLCTDKDLIERESGTDGNEPVIFCLIPALGLAVLLFYLFFGDTLQRMAIVGNLQIRGSWSSQGRPFWRQLMHEAVTHFVLLMILLGFILTGFYFNRELDTSIAAMWLPALAGLFFYSLHLFAVAGRHTPTDSMMAKYKKGQAVS